LYVRIFSEREPVPTCILRVVAIFSRRSSSCNAKSLARSIENASSLFLSCERSCVHVNLLKPAPYYAIWNPGPRARDPRPGERMPLYKHDPDRMTPELRGISMQNLDVSMSRICKSEDHKFLAFTM